MSTTTAVSTPSSVHADDLLDDFILERVSYWASQVARTFDLSDEEREDVRHDLVLELLDSAVRFDPAQSAWHTFASNVLRLAASRIRRDRGRRASFRPKYSRVLLEQTTVSEPHSVIDPHDDIGDLERRLDVEQVLASMPPVLRRTCELLKHLSPPEVARVMGVHRVTVYRRVAQARCFFEEAGLDPSGNGASNSAPAQM